MSVLFDSTFPTITVSFQFPSPIGTVDVTEFVEECHTFNGRQREADRFDARGSLLLNNWDGRFTPANLSGPYVSGGVSFVRPRVGVHITAVWNSGTYDVFTGDVTTWSDNWKGDATVEGFDSVTEVTFTGRYSRIAAWDGQPVAPVGEGELSGARVSRILTAVGWSGGTSIAAGSVPMAATDLSGNGMQQILEVVDAEGGAFYIEPNGSAVFESRSSLVTNSRSNTSQVTFSEASVFVRDVSLPIISDDLLYNSVTFQRAGGVAQTASDSTSQSRYGVRSYTRTGLPALEDVWMMSVAEFNVARWKDPEYRVGSVTIDPNVSPSLMWPHALGRRIHDRATVTVFNARSNVTVSHNVFIEGVEHRFSQMRWSTTFHFSSATAWTPFSVSVWDTGVWDTAKWFY
jgi:hypothetical protein